MAIRLKAGLLYSTICTLLFIRCTFEPSEVFISTISPPEPISVSFIINDPNFKDPFNLIAPTRLIFRLDNMSNAIIGTDIRLNGRSLNPAVTSNGVEFVLNPYELAAGNHTIHMSFSIDTKSGSLANKLGAEYYLVEQSFTVVVDKDPPVFDTFEAGMENGFLTFRWNGTEKINFVYKIRRNSSSGYLPDSIIYETQTKQFIDRGYLGGYLDYQIFASGVGFEVLVGSGTILHEPVEFQIIKSPEGMAQLSWTTDNINTDNLTLQINSSIDGVKNMTIPFTTSGTKDLGKVGIREIISLSATVYRAGYFSQRHRTDLQIDPTPNIKPFKAYKILKDQNKLLVGTDQKIYRYNLDNMVLEDSLTLLDHGLYSLQGLIATPDGSRAYIIDYNTFISFDPVRFDNFISFDLEEISGEIGLKSSSLYFEMLGNVTDNGLISIIFRRGSNYGVILDLRSGKVIWQSAAGNRFVPIISDDGKYFAASEVTYHLDFESWIYRLDGKQYYRLGKIDPADFAFLANGTELVSFYRFRAYSQIYDGEIASVYNLLEYPQDKSAPFTKIRNAPIHASHKETSLRNITYDPYTNYIVFTYGNAVKLMNASTLKYEKTIEGQLPYYSNNYVLQANGFIEVVK